MDIDAAGRGPSSVAVAYLRELGLPVVMAVPALALVPLRALAAGGRDAGGEAMPVFEAVAAALGDPRGPAAGVDLELPRFSLDAAAAVSKS